VRGYFKSSHFFKYIKGGDFLVAKSYIQKIEEDINSLILEEGFDLEYVENINENGRNVVRIVIDKKEESISADD
jgi:ribosome maturation factor RimP